MGPSGSRTGPYLQNGILTASRGPSAARAADPFWRLQRVGLGRGLRGPVQLRHCRGSAASEEAGQPAVLGFIGPHRVHRFPPKIANPNRRPGGPRRPRALRCAYGLARPSHGALRMRRSSPRPGAIFMPFLHQGAAAVGARKEWAVAKRQAGSPHSRNSWFRRSSAVSVGQCVRGFVPLLPHLAPASMLLWFGLLERTWPKST